MTVPRQGHASSTKNAYRAVFVSDLHMGAQKFPAEDFLTWLQSFDTAHLYLGGDIIDGWKLGKSWYWPETYPPIIAEILRKAANGTKVTYITGNHDISLRHLSSRRIEKLSQTFSIDIKNIYYHRTLKGQRFVLLHGDQFDRAILRGPVSEWGDRFHHYVTERLLSRFTAYVKIDGKKKRFSLAKALRTSGTRTLYLIRNFERIAIKRAHRENVDGIICGHTHIPVIKTMKGKIYANSGSWMSDTPTCLAETMDGDLNLLDINPPTENSGQDTLFEKNGDSVSSDLYAYYPQAERLIKHIKKIWA